MFRHIILIVSLIAINSGSPEAEAEDDTWPNGIGAKLYLNQDFAEVGASDWLRILRKDRVEIEVYLGDSTYLVFIPRGAEANVRKHSFIKAVEPLSAQDKISEELKLAMSRTNAKRLNDRFAVRVAFFASQKEKAEPVLRKYSADISREFQSDFWEVIISPEGLQKLGLEPIVKRIELTPDRTTFKPLESD